ncbi:Retrovirus-related Pol polyprotein from type-1 retrotransposable element R2 [Durusdinium trenchii]|uniref:Retrovirus-related Pol polyprotein from type-1 retrotransposable element R2 n=1 Tax=Durusdinium trenchii TaxID=1381693 RepID=A0ABP0RRM3_9DINO
MTGIQPHVALEISPFTCAHLSANHYPKVLQGDLASKADVGRFHQAMGGVRSGLCAGFPCQPFSSMGAQLHFSDPRASVFFRVLDAAYLVQSSYLILECVPGVQGLRPITQALDRFCEVMSFHWAAKVLHLGRALPSRRTRWWLVALPTSLNLPKLSDLPLALHRQTLGQLVRQWPTWPKEEERELKLTQSELDMYQDPAYGVLPRLLDMNGVAPTLLHSAGHHLVDCPCGCRGPISDVTLRARGWQAIVVNSNYSDIALRHVHHNEAAFLVGAPFGLVALGERKALLPLLGQIASPIQAHWILAQVLDANGMLGDRTLFDAHERVMNHHVQEHLRRWPTRANQIPRQISIVFERDPVLHVTVHESVSVRALLEATGHHIGAVLELRPNDAAWLHPQGYVPPGPLSIAVRMIGQGKRPFSLAMDDPAVIVPRDGLDDYTIHHQAMRLFAKAGRDDFVFFTPRFVAHLLEVWSHFAQQEILRVLNGKTTAIGVLWDCGHWIAFRVEKHGSQLEATSFDGVTMEATADMAIQTWLETFLPTKGVPVEAAKARAQAAIKKLGVEALDAAISSADPWRGLKQAGGALSKPFQWVQYTELQQHIAQRSETRHGASNKPDKLGNRGKRVELPLNITPENLELLPNCFFDAMDEPLGMITMQNLRPDQRGLAIATEEQAVTFLKDSRNISTDAFGLLTIGELANSDSDSRVEHLHWTALYRPTQEPVIIRGSLINLGDVSIEKKAPAKAQTMPKIDTEVLRIQVFADMADTWPEFLRGPVKQIISQVSALRFCREPSCDGKCGLFHPAVDEKILTHSGDFGIFIEPRPDSTSGSHPSFCVVWLNRSATPSDALHYKRTQEFVLGLARLGNKLGLRALCKHESALLKVVYPDRAFTACQVRFIYEMGPVPHGLSRDQLNQILKDWGWVARPLKVFRSTADGKFWDIGTSTAPPAPVLETEHGDLTVAKKRDAEKSAKTAPIVSAPMRTSAHLKANTAGKAKALGSEDIWMTTEDPWASYKAAQASSVPKMRSQRLGDLEARLKQEMKQQIQDLAQKGTSASSGLSPDTTALRTDVDELKAQQTKMAGMIQDSAAKVQQLHQHAAEQAKQIQQLGDSFTLQVRAHDGQIRQLGEAIQTQATATDAVTKEVTSLKASLADQLTAAMDSQTNRLEALLEKRSRTS